MPDDTLTGARLVEAVQTAAGAAEQQYLELSNETGVWDRGAWLNAIARAALRAQAEAAGVTAALLSDMARHHDVVATRLGVEWDRHGYDADKPHRQTAALLRALAEVLRDE